MKIVQGDPSGVAFKYNNWKFGGDLETITKNTPLFMIENGRRRWDISNVGTEVRFGTVVAVDIETREKAEVGSVGGVILVSFNPLDGMDRGRSLKGTLNFKEDVTVSLFGVQ